MIRHDPTKEDHAIVKTEVTAFDVIITLNNGVVLQIGTNPNYFHCHFSGTKDHIVATPFANHPGFDLNRLKLANYVDLEYTKSRDW